MRLRRAHLLVSGAMLAVGALGSCARTGFPPGGERDFYPPVVVSTSPDTFEMVDDLGRKIVVQFSERISERPRGGTLEDAVILSPLTGRLKVSHKRSAIEIEVDGGLKPGLVYRLTLLPTLVDMFNNSMQAPFEYVFSTGGEFEDGVIAGLVLDRITGEPVEGAQILMQEAGVDSAEVVYLARTDSSGIYALRYVPGGQYSLQAFEDVNRSRDLDPFEAFGERLSLISPGDTLLADLVILAPDTTAAVLAQATLLDSMSIQLSFDDHIEPTMNLGGVVVTLEAVPDTTEEGITDPPPGPQVVRLLHEREFTVYRDSLDEVRLAVADSLAEAARVARADSVAAAAGAAAQDSIADSLGVAVNPPGAEPPGAVPPGAVQPGATVEPGVGRPQGGVAQRIPGRGGAVARPVGRARSLLPEGLPLPSQDIMVILQDAIPAGHTYRVVVNGLVNLRGLGGGGGDRTVRRELPEVPDSTAVPPDSGSVVIDTAGVGIDTAGVGVDTVSGVIDTLRIGTLRLGGARNR